MWPSLTVRTCSFCDPQKLLGTQTLALIWGCLPGVGERLIGDAAKNQATTNPARTVYDVKRLIGRKCVPLLQAYLVGTRL